MDGATVVFPILAGVLAVMVAVLLVWKMASVYWENLEVARLEKELTNSEFVVLNPIYEEPITPSTSRKYAPVTQEEKVPDIAFV